MGLPLPPLDAHSHVETTILPGDLTKLNAVVFAVTRKRGEWQLASQRPDQLAIWGVGCHPALGQETRRFEAEDFRALLPGFALVGEVGLDGRARQAAPLQDQIRTFSEILDMVAECPRPISIHSVGASKQVLDCIERRPQRGAVLHWWRGSQAETQRAIELGCFFSLNGAEVMKPKVLELLPQNRVLTETDFPHTKGTDPSVSRPGEVGSIEVALAKHWATDEWGVRLQVWKNFRDLVSRTDASRLPTGVRKLLLTVPA